MTSPSENSALQQEWTTLQNNHEQYEKSALLIKLMVMALFFIGLLLALSPLLAGLVVLLLWMQEGILRTSQARLGERILRIEALLRHSEAVDATEAAEPNAPSASSARPAWAFQLHSEWLAGRGAAGSLVAEYARHALRPTVAFPYAVLVLIQWMVWVA